MSLKKIHDHIHTLSFILTMQGVLIISTACFCCYLVCYFIFSSAIYKNVDKEMFNEFSEYSRLLKEKNIDTVKTAIDLEVESEGINKMFFRIIDMDGLVKFSSNMSWWGDVPIDKSVIKGLKKDKVPVLKTIHLHGHHSKARIGYGLIGNGVVLQLGRYMKDQQQLINIFRRAFRASIAGALFLSILCCWFLVRWTLTGIDEVTRVALNISNRNLTTRASVKTKITEIKRLATAFNEMLDLITDLIKSIQEVTDNIAHDLRTPIARIRGAAELALTSGNSKNSCENMAASTIEECDRLLNMINVMLDITETETGTGNMNVTLINMSDVVKDACDLFEPIAEEKNIDLSVEIEEEDLKIIGDVSKMQRMLANLLDNALKYTLPGGSVKVCLQLNPDKGIALSVVDTGIGISNSDLPKIFDRFYRCDQSRSQPGSGLGLCLALAIARAHGGDILVDSGLSRGSTFTVMLPRVYPQINTRATNYYAGRRI